MAAISPGVGASEHQLQREKEKKTSQEMQEVEERLKALQREQMESLWEELQPMLDEVEKELKSYISEFKREFPPPAKKPEPLPPNMVAPQMPDMRRATDKLEALSQAQALRE